MPRKNFKNLRAGLVERVGEELVANAEQGERDRYELEQLALGDVRRARALTQTQLAKALGVSQAQVSRIESQTDLFLSTLASYIEAMGGELDLVASFPDDDKRVSINIGELSTPREVATDIEMATLEAGATPTGLDNIIAAREAAKSAGRLATGTSIRKGEPTSKRPS